MATPILIGDTESAKALSQAIILGSHAVDKGQKVIYQATKILRGIQLTDGNFNADKCGEDIAAAPFYAVPDADATTYTNLVNAADSTLTDSSVKNVINNADAIFNDTDVNALDAATINPATLIPTAGTAPVGNKTLVGGKSRKHRRGKANKTKGKRGKKGRTRRRKR